MIRHVRRVSVHSPHYAIGEGPPQLDAITQFHNLHVSEIHPWFVLRREMIQTHITTLYGKFNGWSAFEALASLPHLQYLRLSLFTFTPISSRVKLFQLKTLHVESYDPFH